MKYKDARTYELLCKTEITNINEQVKNKKTKIIGMDEELKCLIKALRRLKKPNAMIIGKEGIGKTALVEKLAIAINKKEVPSCLKNKIILSLNINGLVAGTRYRGEFEDKVEDIIQLAKNNQEVIFFIDEFHTAMHAGGNSNETLNFSNIFKPYLSRGEIKLIGATTENEYKRYIAPDKAFRRRFKILKMKEPDVAQTINILKGVKEEYEKHYNCKITDEEIFIICIKAMLFKRGTFPDKAFDLMEEEMMKKQDTE